MFQEKFKSPILHAGLVALLIFLVKKYAKYELTGEFADVIIDILISGIITLSIWNNPNERDKL